MDKKRQVKTLVIIPIRVGLYPFMQLSIQFNFGNFFYNKHINKSLIFCQFVKAHKTHKKVGLEAYFKINKTF